MGNAEKILICLVVILGFASGGDPEITQGGTGQGACQGCARRAVLERATSNIPFYVENPQTLHRSTQSRLVEALTTPCFHLIGPEAVESAGRPAPGGVPEYVLLTDFSSAQPTSGGVAKAGATRLTLELLYNGEPRETVFRLATDSPIEDYSSQVNRMYTNPDAAINQVKPIDRVLRDFERRPVACTMDLANAGELTPGEEVEVKLADFRDEQGRPSKPFNRLVVEAEHGEIKGGSRLLAGPNKRVFRVEEGVVKFIYQAPKDCSVSQDRISVHSSCSILDPGKDPLPMTSVDKKIAEKTIDVGCPDLVADYNTTIKVSQEALSGEFFSTVRASYRLSSSRKMDNGTIHERYKLLSSTLRNFWGQAKYSKKWETADCAGRCSGQATPSGARLSGKGGVGFNIVYDEKTGSVQKVELDSINVETECVVPFQCQEKCRTPPYDRSFSGKIPVFLERAIEVVHDFPMKVEKVSGSREGGTVSGSARMVFGENYIVTELQFFFRKIRR